MDFFFEKELTKLDAAMGIHPKILAEALVTMIRDGSALTIPTALKSQS